jgi:hypothetical protein
MLNAAAKSSNPHTSAKPAYASGDEFRAFAVAKLNNTWSIKREIVRGGKDFNHIQTRRGRQVQYQDSKNMSL